MLQQPRFKPIPIALLLLGAGIVVSFRLRYDNAFRPMGVAQALLLSLVLVISFITPLRMAAARLIDRLRAPSPRGKALTVLLIFLISYGYLIGAAFLHARDMSPRMQDEFSYLIQAQLLSQGKLWLPSPPLADFFETFHVLVKPVYASVYFPGTALLYVPGVWLHIGHAYTAVALCALGISLTYLLACELLDGAWAILAAFIPLSAHTFFSSSTLALSNVPAMVFALLTLLAWLRWRRPNLSLHSRAIWAALLGAAIGWGMIIRPLDMIAYLVPLAILTLLELRAMPPSHRATLLFCVLAIAPFGALQLIFDKDVTGRWFTTPYQSYFDQFQPGTHLGFFKDDLSLHAQTTLQQKIDLYDTFLHPLLRDHRPDMIFPLLLRWRLKFTAGATMPTDLLMLFVPIGIVAAARDRLRFAIGVGVPLLYLGLYTFYPYYMPYYPIVIAPAVAILLLMGARRTLEMFSNGPSRGLRVFTMFGIFAVCLAALPEVRMDTGNEVYIIPGLRGMNQLIPQRIAPPAVLLFKYESPASPHSEPVYNYDVANPLDAPIIRAHDLGTEKNREIISWFAAHRPQTMFHRYDRGTELRHQLGTAEQLERRGLGLRAAPQTQPATR